MGQRLYFLWKNSVFFGWLIGKDGVLDE